MNAPADPRETRISELTVEVEGASRKLQALKDKVQEYLLLEDSAEEPTVREELRTLAED